MQGLPHLAAEGLLPERCLDPVCLGIIGDRREAHHPAMPL
jgi:hypothetical protein